MICFRCGKSIKGTGAQFIPNYRLTVLNIHLLEKCPKNKLVLNGITQILKVRELAGLDNSKILDHIFEFTGFDKEKFKKDILKTIKSNKRKL